LPFIIFFRAHNEKLEKERDLARQEKARNERLIKQYKLEKGHVLEVRNFLLLFLPFNLMVVYYKIKCHFILSTAACTYVRVTCVKKQSSSNFLKSLLSSSHNCITLSYLLHSVLLTYFNTYSQLLPFFNSPSPQFHSQPHRPW
jgi:hypothetical protein